MTFNFGLQTNSSLQINRNSAGFQTNNSLRINRASSERERNDLEHPERLAFVVVAALVFLCMSYYVVQYGLFSFIYSFTYNVLSIAGACAFLILFFRVGESVYDLSTSENEKQVKQATVVLNQVATGLFLAAGVYLLLILVTYNPK